MADSDDEYIADLSDGDDVNYLRNKIDDNYNDEIDHYKDPFSVKSHRLQRSARSGKSRGGNKEKKKQHRGEWEVARTWETLVEGADGTIGSTVEGILEAGKKKR